MIETSYQSPYQSRPEPGNPRQTEAWALTEAARRINEAKSKDAQELLAAVRLNWKLWTIFQAELSSPTCEVPKQIRENMLSLCGFVDKISVALIAEPDPGEVEPLISINRHIARGLLGNGGDADLGASSELASDTSSADPDAKSDPIDRNV